MSRRPAGKPDAADGVALVIEPRRRHLAGTTTVRRVLPVVACRHVGPFVFLDHFGPLDLLPGEGMDVPPHPHIGLATVTWLLEGVLVHRDSLGSHQTIRPGAVNWMTAGRGIVHSERTPPDRSARSRLHGLQMWVALPVGDEECAPSFHHEAVDGLPEVEQDGARARVLVGSAWGVTSPVPARSPMLCADVRVAPGARLVLPEEHPERAAYLLDGDVVVERRRFAAGRMLVFEPGPREVHAPAGARLLLLGGRPLGDRFMEWNFVSSTRERIARAKEDWREGRFPLVPGDEDERVALPR